MKSFNTICVEVACQKINFGDTHHEWCYMKNYLIKKIGWKLFDWQVIHLTMCQQCDHSPSWSYFDVIMLHGSIIATSLNNGQHDTTLSPLSNTDNWQQNIDSAWAWCWTFVIHLCFEREGSSQTSYNNVFIIITWN